MAILERIKVALNAWEDEPQNNLSFYPDVATKFFLHWAFEDIASKRDQLSPRVDCATAGYHDRITQDQPGSSTVLVPS